MRRKRLQVKAHMGAAVRRPPPPGELPYTYDSAAAEIEAWLSDKPRGTQKRLAAAAGIDSQSFSHRMTQYRGERFTIEMFAAIAKEAGAPLGWPFVPWNVGQAFDAFRKLLPGNGKHRR